MINPFWITLLIIVIGIVLVILPDHDKSLFNFNKDHGPSLHDVLGLILIVSGWCFILFRIFLKRKTVLKSLGARTIMWLVILILTGNALIVVGLRIEKDFVLWMGVLFSILGYGILLIPAFRKEVKNSIDNG